MPRKRRFHRSIGASRIWESWSGGFQREKDMRRILTATLLTSAITSVAITLATTPVCAQMDQTYGADQADLASVSIISRTNSPHTVIGYTVIAGALSGNRAMCRMIFTPITARDIGSIQMSMVGIGNQNTPGAISPSIMEDG